MAKQKFEIEIDVPDGYKVIAFRPPKRNELILGYDLRYPRVHVVRSYNHRCRFILKETS